jgi:hypothetical protein
LQTGLEQLFNQLIRPRLRNLLDEVYRDTTYLLDEDGFAEADEADIVRKRFARGWEILVEGYRVSGGSGPSPSPLPLHPLRTSSAGHISRRIDSQGTVEMNRQQIGMLGMLGTLE